MRRILLICFVVLVPSFNLFAQVDLLDGLVAYYPFSGNAGDSSGNANHGIVTGAQLTLDRFGKSDKAYYFDGNSDYINLGNSVSIKRYKSDFTFSGWIKLDEYSASYHSIILSNRNAGAGSLIGIGGTPSSLNKKFEFVKNVTVTSDENTYDHLGSKEDIALNKWVFVCVSYKYQGNKMNEVKLYINGVLSSVKNIGETLDPGNVNSYLGIEPSFLADYAFKGSLDDIRFYNRVLNECEIIALANEGNDNSLIGDYSFSGNADDASSNLNNGIVNGATLTTDRFGNENSAYSFDGVNDYISISPTNIMVENYTYSTWVNIKTLPGDKENDFIISIGKSAGDQNISIGNNYSTGSSTGWSVGGYDIGGATVSTFQSGSLPFTSTWYHVVYTRDNSFVKLYVNGVFIGSKAANSLPYYGTSGQAAMIGTRSHGNQQYFNGLIDDVKIYNRALSACEISDLYDSEVITSINPNVGNVLNVSVYPNPLSNKQLLRIESEDMKNAEIRLLNSLGEEVYKVDGVNQTVQLNLNLTQGIYILKIKSDKGESSRKILIN